MPAFTMSCVTWEQAEASLSFIRRLVFIQEQAVPEDLEWDGLDEDAIHLLALCHDKTPIGTARMCCNGHIGRMAVMKDWRHQGVGSALLLELIAIARLKTMPQVVLDAQVHALSFYENYGFVICSDVFMDAGIAHKKMKQLL